MTSHPHRLLSFSIIPGLLSVWVATLASLLAFADSARAGDWPRWRGPNLDGISQETGWVANWPQEGPKKLWEADLGVGYSSFSVAQGRVYTMGNRNQMDVVWCLDAETGKVHWQHEYPCSPKDPNGYLGTRCTPTVDGDRVYSVSRDGQFFCLDAAKGTVVWSKKFKQDFGAKPPTWGYSGSPLIEKDWVLYEVGASNAAVVAFDKKTGAVVWQNGKSPAGYSSLTPFDVDGERLLAVFPAAHFVVVRMKDGSEVGRIPWKTSYGVNAATPVIAGSQIFISSGYGFGCALLSVDGSGLKEVWRNKAMRNHVNSCVLWQGYLYGFDESDLKCLELKSGEVKWANNDFGKGSLNLAGGRLIIYSQSGKLVTADPSPSGFKAISSAQILDGKDTWAVPVLANGRIYCRSLDKAACVDVKGK